METSEKRRSKKSESERSKEKSKKIEPKRDKKSKKKDIDIKLENYMGQWYEIARYPQPYEDPNAVNVISKYVAEENPNGKGIKKITITNYEEVDGKAKVLNGVAKVMDVPTQFKVSFNDHRPDHPNYYIMSVGYFSGKKDQDGPYDYSIVSNGECTGLWILSRDPKMSAFKYGRLLQMLNTIEDGNYDTRLLVTTQHTKYSTVVKE